MRDNWPTASAPWRWHVCAVFGYVVLALVFAWPLPLHLATHLTGSPEGDTGVYVWNQWVFQHEILTHHTSPYFTDRIFSLTGRANLSLHNYTTLANLLALPLVGSSGVVATFNLTYLFLTVLSGYAMFLLARAITPVTESAAWLAGALFAWSPMLVTRGAGHFSLVAAAPLPLFMLLLLRADSHRRLRDGAWLGLMTALAFWSDVYYAIYCVILAAAYVGWQSVRVERRPAALPRQTLWRVVDAMILCAAGLVVAIAISHGWLITVFGHPISIRELYTPVLVLTILITFRLARRYRAIVVAVNRTALVSTVRLALVAGLIAALLLSPLLSALWSRVADGRFVSPPIFWRSSPAGVDLLAMAVPNPNHPLAPTAWRLWLSDRFDGYLESVASIPLSAVLVVCLAWRNGWRAPRLWVVLGLAFTLLSLGPFIHIGGINTYVPGPWALLRYVPIIGLARNPARFAVLIMLAVAVLFALAFSSLRETQARRPWLRWAITVLVILELLPIPRPLYSARVPTIYDRIAADPRHDVRVLQLPFGVRDGVSSVGNYTARTQFFQTRHGKPLVGGVLSRVSEGRVKAIRSYPILDAFIQLSEGRLLQPGAAEQLAAHTPKFLAHANIGYVVIDHTSASPALVDFAIRTLHLEELESDGLFVLYRPKPPRASP